MAKVMEVNVLTGEVIKRDMTADELAMQQSSRSETLTREAEQASKLAAKEAVLLKLGLTQEEAAALLG
jgi:hypothetical protein